MEKPPIPFDQLRIILERAGEAVERTGNYYSEDLIRSIIEELDRNGYRIVRHGG